MGGDQLQTVPGLLGRREPSWASACPDAAPGARGPTSLAPSGSLPPTPGAARLAPRTEAPAPSSHETRAGTVRARVVQRALTLWRLPPPPRAHGVLAAGTRRRGVGGEGGGDCLPAFVPTSGQAGWRKFGSRARARSCPAGSAHHGVRGGDALSFRAEWPGGNVAASPEGRARASPSQRCLLLSTQSIPRNRVISGFWICTHITWEERKSAFPFDCKRKVI